MDYGFTHEGKVYTPNGTIGVSPAENADRNQQIAQAELAQWVEQPDRQLAYYHEPSTQTQTDATRSALGVIPWTVTTWTGVVLGTVTTRRIYRHNFGGRFVAITVKGTNGAIYHGRASYDHGQCIWLRKAR